MDITATASLSNSASPKFVYNYAPQKPDPKPPPHTPTIHVVDLHPYEYKYNESMPVDKIFTIDVQYTVPSIVPDTSHLLWTFHIIPTEELVDNSINPATIITLLAKDDASLN